jgi:hypothetical protein
LKLLHSERRGVGISDGDLKVINSPIVEIIKRFAAKLSIVSTIAGNWKKEPQNYRKNT